MTTSPAATPTKTRRLFIGTQERVREIRRGRFRIKGHKIGEQHILNCAKQGIFEVVFLSKKISQIPCFAGITNILAAEPEPSPDDYFLIFGKKGEKFFLLFATADRDHPPQFSTGRKISPYTDSSWQ